MWTEREAVDYLLGQGLLSPLNVTEGGLAVSGSSRRNRNFLVTNQNGPSYMLKQGIGPERGATISREARVYGLLGGFTGKDRFAQYLPKFYRYDPSENLLVIELVKRTPEKGRPRAGLGFISPTVAAELGRAISRLHGLSGKPGAMKEDLRAYSPDPPWILTVHRPSSAMIRDFTGATIELIKTVQQVPEFCALLDQLGSDWTLDSFIHYDLKWDNFILTGGPGPGLRIVDWEFAGKGDPCWDVGSVFTDYLASWLLSIPIEPSTRPEQFPDLARNRLDRMQPAMRSFWQNYRRGSDLEGKEARQFLVRAARFAAARLLQSTLEKTQMSLQMTGNVICFVQVSLNILRRPDEAVVQLLGIPMAERFSR